MADSIDGFKPSGASPGAGSSTSSNVRSVPAQQARPGWNGFDGGSYFELGAGAAPRRDQHMLDPPATTGPRATAKQAIARTLEALGLQPGAAVFIPPERA